jgi:hypothetical protein
MPRIRTIKPDFWDDEKMARLSLQANLLFIGMWNFSDDDGIIRKGANWIKSNVYPHREELRLSDVKSWIEELEKARLLIPFVHNGEGYYIIRTFKKHQRVEKPQASKIPKEVFTKVLSEFCDKNKTILGSFGEESGSDTGTIPSVLVREEYSNSNIPPTPKEEKEEKFEIESEILEHFGFNEINNQRKCVEVHQLCVTLNHRKRLEYFTEQFRAYVQYRKANTGRTMWAGFSKFIGTGREFFEDGKWNENWVQALNEYRKANGATATGRVTIQR